MEILLKKHLRSCILLCLFALAAAGAQGQATPPNFVLFIADDVSWDDFGCYGNEVVQTPNIDRIAGRGLRFTNAFLTTSSCSPSRNSIITGRYPHNTGAAELHTSPPETMLAFPKWLKERGYYTVLAGKSHMGPFAYREFDRVLDKNTGDGGEAHWVSSLEERPKDRPFFMWFAALDAHRVWGENRFSGTHHPDDITPPPYLADDEATRRDLASYYDEITRFDYYVGEVERVLREQGVLDNTVLLIMADNGRPFSRCKTRLYDSGIQTPFIVTWGAGIPAAPATCHRLISAVDIAPTLLDLAGIAPPETIQGHSFKRLLLDPQAPFRDRVFAEHNWHDFEAHERMVRTDDFLYIRNFRPQFPNQGPADVVNSDSHAALVERKAAGRLSAPQADMFITPRPYEELYDCRSDPMQLVNVAGTPRYQRALLLMRGLLDDWMARTDDSVPDDLTVDWYDRHSGNRLPDQPQVRGTMPGAGTEATTNTRRDVLAPEASN